jgi:hypothetical protein
MNITHQVAQKVLDTVDAGLVNGVGRPIPGQMCVEAAVCYALGLPHGDDPRCVSRALRSLKISLNDAAWASPQSRAKGMRRLALAQLGSAGVLNDKEFVERVVLYTVNTTISKLFHDLAERSSGEHQQQFLTIAKQCVEATTLQQAQDAADYAAKYAAKYAANADYAAKYAANAADYAADYAAKYAANAEKCAANVADGDQVRADYAEGSVQILIELKAPGCQWLSLTEAK